MKKIAIVGASHFVNRMFDDRVLEEFASCGNYRWARDSAWHIASWVPTDPLGPTVLMNRDCPIVLEAIKYHQEQYPDVFADEVAEIVQRRGRCLQDRALAEAHEVRQRAGP